MYFKIVQVALPPSISIKKDMSSLNTLTYISNFDPLDHLDHLEEIGRKLEEICSECQI